MPPTFYRGCWHVVSRDFFDPYRPSSSGSKGVYNPKAVILHAALLRQAFAHCAISLTAASRRSRARLSVPVWGTTLSGPLPVFGLVGCYSANYLMGRRLILKREVLRSSALTSASFEAVVLCCISAPFGTLSTTRGEITYVLLTRAPLNRVAPVPFDLHVLSAPLTFVLSQDQTLQLDLERSELATSVADAASLLWLTVRWHPEGPSARSSRSPFVRLNRPFGGGTHINVSVRFSFQGPGKVFLPSRGQEL